MSAWWLSKEHKAFEVMLEVAITGWDDNVV